MMSVGAIRIAGMSSAEVVNGSSAGSELVKRVASDVIARSEKVYARSFARLDSVTMRSEVV